MEAKNILLTTVVMLTFSIATNAQITEPKQPQVPRHGINIVDERDSYTIENGIVYYKGTPLKFADANSFRIIGHGYAKDSYNVYMNGTILPFVDPKHFKLKVQTNDRRPDTFPHDVTTNKDRLLDDIIIDKDGYTRDEYYKTTFDVFFNGKKIKDASASSFVVLKDGYAKDAFNVYYRGLKIEDASTFNFECDGRGYAHDSFNAYYKGKKLK